MNFEPQYRDDEIYELLRIGSLTVFRIEFDKYFIRCKDGEGLSIKESDFEKILLEYKAKHF